MESLRLPESNSTQTNSIIADFLKVYEKPIIEVVEDYLHAKENADRLFFTRLAAISTAEKNRLGEWLTDYCLLKIIGNETPSALEYELFASVIAYNIVKNCPNALVYNLLLKSVEKGNDNARVNLAYCYQEGLGVTQNYRLAYDACNTAYEHGYLRAAYNLGFFYASGNFVRPDNRRALELYNIAAVHGSESAMNAIGNLYLQGTIGGGKNLIEAFKWYEMAARNGSVEALYNLGNLYYENLDVKAIEYFQQAAKKNYAPAFYKLGSYYENNFHLSTNKAYIYYYKEAGKRGYRIHDNILRNLPPLTANDQPDTFINEIQTEPREQSFDTLKGLIQQLNEPPQSRYQFNTYVPPAPPRSMDYASFNNHAYSPPPYHPAYDISRRILPTQPTSSRTNTTSNINPVNTDRNEFDYAIVKAMVALFIDNLVKIPHKAPELLKKVAVVNEKSKEDVQAIVKSAFAGDKFPIEENELVSDLLEINSYARKSSTDLRFKSKLSYSTQTIAKMVHDATLESVLESLVPTIANAVNKSESLKKAEDPNQSRSNNLNHPATLFGNSEAQQAEVMAVENEEKAPQDSPQLK